MPQLTRVAWTEGMHLSQHHFQAQSRYAEDSIAFTLRQLISHAFGFTTLTIDEASIPRGIVSLQAASGILPDGLAFHMPSADALPASLAVERVWPAGADRVTVWLTVPSLHRGRASVRTSAASSAEPLRATRFIAETVVRSDDFAGGDERDVSICRKNIALTLAPALDDEIAMPVLRLRRQPSGELSLDQSFIPPCLHLAASGVLRTRLRRLTEVLRAKSDALAPVGDQTALVNYAARELPTFWLIHTVRSALPALHHLLQTPRAHPEKVFIELSRLAGALCSFGLDSRADTLPQYQHDDASTWFDALELHIRRHLELIVPDGCVLLPLMPTTEVLYTTRIEDPRARAAARWFLGVSATVPDATLRKMVPDLIKVAAASQVLGLVRDAVPGLVLEHVPITPPALAANPHMQYFRIARRGAGADGIARTHEVGVYVPTTLAQPTLELRILLDD
jgi:type VI secretion system protein ImpJ